MAKSLSEIDLEFADSHNIELSDESKENSEVIFKEENPARRKVRIVSDIVFWALIILMVVGAFLYSQSAEKGSSFMGFSVYKVLSGSMQSEIPEGSLVFVKQVNTDTLKVGDDITFFSSKNVVITHRIVNIYEDYNGTGTRGFQTKGVENAEPDVVIVNSGNVIGKAFWHIPVVGYVMNFISQNIFFCIIMFLLGIGVVFCLRIYLAPDDPAKKRNRRSK